MGNSISNPCFFAARFWLWDKYATYEYMTSNKEKMTPKEWKTEPIYSKGSGWYKGYSFQHFWGNCHSLLNELAEVQGIQQLCHHYYLQNGSLDAMGVVKKIKVFLAKTESHD